MHEQPRFRVTSRGCLPAKMLSRHGDKERMGLPPEPLNPPEFKDKE